MINRHDIYKSMQTKINDRIQALKERIEKATEKLNSNKLNFNDKSVINISIKQYKEDIIKLTELSKSLNNLHFSSNNKSKLEEKTVEQLKEINQFLTNEETSELRTAIAKSLSNANKENKKNVKASSSKVQKLLTKLRLSDKELSVDGLEYTKVISYKGAINQIEKELLNDLKPDYTSIYTEKLEVSLSDTESTLITTIEEMITNKTLKQSKNTNNIVLNISKIKEAMIARKKAQTLTLKISNALNSLNNITEIDISEIKKFLIKQQKKYQKELAKSEKYISKFNFNEIKKQIE